MSTAPHEQPPRTTTELLCREAGVTYTAELQQLDAACVRFQELTRVAKLLEYLKSLEPTPPTFYTRLSNSSKPFETF